MPTWTLSVRTAPESGLPSVDVEVHARPEATVADLAQALGRHLAPDQRRLDVVPLEGRQPWPASRPLAECGLRTGDLIDVVTAPHAWRDRPAQTTKPRAVLHVTEGPDRGQRLHVRGSSLTLGRGPHCTMRFTDSLVSQQHARIELGARPTVYDEGSANGTTVGDLPVTSPREIDWGTSIKLGRSTVVIEAGEVVTEDPIVSVFRPPRFGDPLAEETLDVPAPPEKRRPSPLPWAMFALPVVMGFAMFMRSQTPYALVYMLAWPLVGYFGWRQQKKQAEREFQEELAEWREDVDDAADHHRRPGRAAAPPLPRRLRRRRDPAHPGGRARPLPVGAPRGPRRLPRHPTRHRHRACPAARRGQGRRRPAGPPRARRRAGRARPAPRHARARRPRRSTR